MEIENNFPSKQKIYQFLQNTQNNHSDGTFDQSLIEVQNYLKKDDTTHIYFSKKLSEEYIYNILSRENQKPAKRFQRKSKNPIVIENLYNVVDLKFFSKSESEQSNLQYLKKIENFEKSMQFINNHSKKEEDYQYRGISKNINGNNCFQADSKQLVQGKIIFEDEENAYKKKRNDISYSNYSNSIYGLKRKKKKSLEDEDEYIQEEEVGFKPALAEIKKNNYKFEPPSRNYNINNTNSVPSQREEAKPVTTYKKFVPPLKSNNQNNSGNTNSVSTNRTSNKENKEDEIGNIYNGVTLEPEMAKKFKSLDKKLLEYLESEVLDQAPCIEWNDIAGLEFAKKTIKEIIIWPMLRPDIFKGIRRPPKGLLLFGPPGTGKTMIAKAIASESKSKFFNISASSLLSKWVGESEKLVRSLFVLAEFYQPSVIFIDEIDSILTARQENENESSRRIKTEFLVQLDGCGTNQDDRILIIGATNRPQEIEDAFIRRMPKRLYIPLPSRIARRQLVVNIMKKEMEKGNKYEIEEEHIEDILNKSKGYSGSDMISVCREAAMMPIRSIEDINLIELDNLREININDFKDALNIVKPSVSDKSLAQYITWNKDFGSFQFDVDEINN